MIGVASGFVKTERWLTVINKLKNCPNCGGILNEAGRCEFCGSKVYDFLNISFENNRGISDKTYIRIKVNGKIFIMPVYVSNCNYTMYSSRDYSELVVTFLVHGDPICCEDDSDED